MAAAYVQRSFEGWNAYFGDTFTLTGTTAGNSVVIFLQINSLPGGMITPATPSGFTLRAGPTAGHYPDAKAWVWVRDSIPGGTITYNPGVPGAPSDGYVSALMVEVSGGVYHSAAVNGQQGGGTLSLSASSSAAGPGLLVACALDTGGASDVAVTTPAETAALTPTMSGMIGSYGTEVLSASESVTVAGSVTGGLSSHVVAYVAFSDAGGGTDATPTPAAIGALPVTVPAPTVTGTQSQTTTPAVAGPLPFTVPAATASGGSAGTASPAVAAAVVTMPAPTVTVVQNATASPAAIAAVVTVPAATASGGITGNAVSWDFDQADGVYTPLPNPFGYGQTFRTVSNRGSTLNNTDYFVGGNSLGALDLTGDFQIDFDTHAPLGIGAGGTFVQIRDSTTYEGWGIFAGNATHIYELPADFGTPSFVSNENRTVEDNHVTMTYTASDDYFRVYLDGVLQSNPYTGRTHGVGTAGNHFVLVELRSTASPTFETWIDNLRIQDYIGAPSPDATPQPLSIAWSATLPAPTVIAQLDATPTPAALPLVVSMDAATVSGTSTATAAPVTVATAVTMDAATPTVVQDVTPAPATITIPVAMDAPTVTGSGNATPSPAVLTGVFAVDAPTATVGGTSAPTAITAAVTMDAPTVTSVTDASSSPVAIPAVVTLDAATASGTSTAVATPAEIVGVFTLEQPAVSGSGTATAAPSSIIAQAFADQATASGTADGATSPAAFLASVLMDQATVSGGSGATSSPAAIVGVFAVDTPVVSVDASTGPTEIAATVTVPTPLVETGSGATATPAEIVAAVTVPSASLLYGATITPATIGAQFYLPTPTLVIGNLIEAGSASSRLTGPSAVSRSAPGMGAASRVTP